MKGESLRIHRRQFAYDTYVKALLMRTHNICFHGEVRKIFLPYTCYLELCNVYSCYGVYWFQVGDGTTSVVLLAGEFLKQAKPFIEENVHPQIVIKAFRRGAALVRFKKLLP